MTADTAPDPLTAAVAALIEHDANCAECDGILPDSQCGERAVLFAARHRALRGAADVTVKIAEVEG